MLPKSSQLLINGVSPVSSRAFTLAPLSIKKRTTSILEVVAEYSSALSRSSLGIFRKTKRAISTDSPPLPKIDL